MNYAHAVDIYRIMDEISLDKLLHLFNDFFFFLYDAWHKNVVQYTTEKYITITLSFVDISFQISEEIPKCQKNDIHNYYQIKFVSR